MTVLLTGLPFRDIRGTFLRYGLSDFFVMVDSTGAVLINAAGEVYIFRTIFPMGA